MLSALENPDTPLPCKISLSNNPNICETEKSVNLLTYDFSLNTAFNAWPDRVSCVSMKCLPVVKTTPKSVIFDNFQYLHHYIQILNFFNASPPF